MRKLALLLLLLFLGSGSTRAADFLTTDYQNTAFIVMLGQINPGDDEAFRRTVLQLLDKGDWISLVYLFSPGGDVATAMRIGEEVRTLKASTVAPILFDKPAGVRACMSPVFPAHPLYFNTRTGRGDTRCNCASACVLIWAAGYGQQGNVVGVHRLHFEASQFGNLSAAAAQSQYDGAEAQVENYLKRMNFPESLTRIMSATSSQDIRYLSKSELSQFPELPPYVQELAIARCGVKHALNSSNSDAVRMKNYACIQAIYQEVSRAGGEEFRKVYGGGIPNLTAPQQ